MNTKLKKRKCKSCNEAFMPTRPLQYVCGWTCANVYQKLLKANKEAKDWRVKKSEMKKALLTHKDWIKLYQITFNTFIRLRDKDLPCVSCGVYNCEEFHAGHYLASTYQYHRFTEINVNKQCSRCNTHLRGNLIPYRIELIKRIGLEDVEYLENSRHMMLEISIPEIQDKIKEYKLKIKDLKGV